MKKYVDLTIIITFIIALSSIVYGYGYLKGQVNEDRKKLDYHQKCIDTMYEKINRIDRKVSEMHGYLKGRQNGKD